ncbi:hypothetical protein CHL67_05360 [Prosthecochloris sp. GSB1]|uniref:DUF2141 domain-containing protein n=1 Tax=Prosthecochloris sp. GSB1 TaxID=281093 RepID=UPI000B8CD889|nr:DUF2141 domain-containing protein [Prosthecochloris sp. GSB1]ASQ90426.1 hypothetical protein CHL67_05360 [Prosthecochloris sp. GSB1]
MKKTIAATLTLSLLLPLSPSARTENPVAARGERRPVPLEVELTSSPAPPGTETGQLSIRIKNFRNATGYVAIALFNSEEGFPGDSERAFALAGTELRGTEFECILENIPFGTYALSVLHDENRNRKMDKTWIGKPKEGFGTSNNPRFRFGPPGFDESRFTLDADEVALEIDMKYL